MSASPLLDAVTAQELIRKLAADREAYLESVNKTHQLLVQLLAASSHPSSAPLSPAPITEASKRVTTANIEVESVSKDKISTITGDDSDDDDLESIFTSTPLEKESYDLEGLRRHLRDYPWTAAGRRILHDVAGNEDLIGNSAIFPVVSGPVQDRSHLSHYSIFDVGPDGAPLEIRSAGGPDPSRAMAIWNRLRTTNGDPTRERAAVGRITIVREPSPLLFGALHYTMQDHFDVDELFQLLVDDDPALAHPHRAFDNDHRHQRSFVMTMEYYTIIGTDCQPMQWQRSDDDPCGAETHIPISRCSSVVALSLAGKPVGRVRNKDRRVDRKFGEVYDPFSPWRVLSIQCYPDWKHSVDAHDSTKHYVNGPEAFLVTLRAEFKDARKRLLQVHERISELVEPPANFMFSRETRDQLLFEDADFTFSRRYFWAYQSLGIMNQDIHEMTTTYRETFKDNIWDGSNKIIWPGEASTSSRYTQWRKRMMSLKKDLDNEMERLEEIEELNEEKRKEIKGLRENLFSGTSVLESRQSVENSRITIEQGRNIKLLTLVTIFFLPLTFVTSVFGQTNIDPNMGFHPFAITTVVICVPTYLLIGSLNTTAGLAWWTKETRTFFSWLGHCLARFLGLFHYRPSWTRSYYAHLQDPPASFPPGGLRGRTHLRQGRSSSLHSQDAAMRKRDTNGGMPQITTYTSNTLETCDAAAMRPAPRHRISDRPMPRSPTAPSPPAQSPRSSTIKFEGRSSQVAPAATSNTTIPEAQPEAQPRTAAHATADAPPPPALGISRSSTIDVEKEGSDGSGTAQSGQEDGTEDGGSILSRLFRRRKDSESRGVAGNKV